MWLNRGTSAFALLENILFPGVLWRNGGWRERNHLSRPRAAPPPKWPRMWWPENVHLPRAPPAPPPPRDHARKWGQGTCQATSPCQTEGRSLGGGSPRAHGTGAAAVAGATQLCPSPLPRRFSGSLRDPGVHGPAERLEKEAGQPPASPSWSVAGLWHRWDPPCLRRVAAPPGAGARVGEREAGRVPRCNHQQEVAAQARPGAHGTDPAGAQPCRQSPRAGPGRPSSSGRGRRREAAYARRV